MSVKTFIIQALGLEMIPVKNVTNNLDRGGFVENQSQT
jgi:hypothetical protein